MDSLSQSSCLQITWDSSHSRLACWLFFLAIDLIAEEELLSQVDWGDEKLWDSKLLAYYWPWLVEKFLLQSLRGPLWRSVSISYPNGPKATLGSSKILGISGRDIPNSATVKWCVEIEESLSCVVARLQSQNNKAYWGKCFQNDFKKHFECSWKQSFLSILHVPVFHFDRF